MAIRYLAGAVLLLTALSGFAQDRDITLLALIEALRERGYAIIYSNSVVQTRQQVRVDSISMEALEQALLERGLLLQQREGIWLISLGSGSEVSQPAAVVSETFTVSPNAACGRSSASS